MLGDMGVIGVVLIWVFDVIDSEMEIMCLGGEIVWLGVVYDVLIGLIEVVLMLMWYCLFDLKLVMVNLVYVGVVEGCDVYDVVVCGLELVEGLGCGGLLVGVVVVCEVGWLYE